MLSNTLETTNSQSQVLNTVVVGACDGSEAQSVYKQRQKEKADQANLNLWQHPFVDVLKHFKVLPGNDWRLNLKKGDVSEYFAKEIGRRCLNIEGTISANNFIQIPHPQCNIKSLGLTGRYIYFEVKSERHGLPFSYHVDLGLAERSHGVRISVSNLFKKFDTQNGFVAQVPLDLKTNVWTVAVLDIYEILRYSQILPQSYVIEGSYQIRSVTVCANTHLRGIYTSDNMYDFVTLPADMRFKFAFDLSKWPEYFDWQTLQHDWSSQKRREQDSNAALRSLAKKKTVSKEEQKDKMRKDVDNNIPITGLEETTASEYIDTEQEKKERQENVQNQLKRQFRQGGGDNPVHGFIGVDDNQLLKKGADQKASLFLNYEGQKSSKLNKDPIMELKHIIGFQPQKCIDLKWSKQEGENAVIFTSGGTLIAMDTEDNSQKKFFFGHSAPISCFDLNMQGTMVASAQEGHNALIRIWDYQTARCISFTLMPVQTVKCLSFSHDGRYLAGCGKDSHSKELLVVYDISKVQKGEKPELVAKQTSEFNILCLKFSPIDSTRLASCGKESIRFWRIRDQGNIRGSSVVLNFHARDTVFICLDFEYGFRSSDKSENESLKRVFVGTKHGMVFQINYQSEVLEATYKTNDAAIYSISVNEAFCVTGSEDTFLRVWPLDFQEFFMEAQHEQTVTSVDISPDGLRVVCGTIYGSIGILDKSNQNYKTLMRSHTDEILAIDFHQAKQQIISISKDKTIRLWSIDNYDEVYEFAAPTDQPLSVSAHPSLPIFSCGFESGRMRVFDIDSTEVIDEFSQFNKPLSSLSYDNSGSLLITCCVDGSVSIHNAGRQHLPVKMLHLDTPPEFAYVRFTEKSSRDPSFKDQKFGLMGEGGNNINVYDTDAFIIQNQVVVNQIITQFRFGNMNQELIVVTKDCRIKFYSLIKFEGIFLKELNHCHRGSISSLSISNNSGYFLSGGEDNLIKIWDYEAQKSHPYFFQSFIGHTYKVNYLLFNPQNNSQVITVGQHDGIYVWDFNGEVDHDHDLALNSSSELPSLADQEAPGSQKYERQLSMLEQIRTANKQKKAFRNLMKEDSIIIPDFRNFVHDKHLEIDHSYTIFKSPIVDEKRKDKRLTRNHFANCSEEVEKNRMIELKTYLGDHSLGLAKKSVMNPKVVNGYDGYGGVHDNLAYNIGAGLTIYTLYNKLIVETTKGRTQAVMYPTASVQLSCMAVTDDFKFAAVGEGSQGSSDNARIFIYDLENRRLVNKPIIFHQKGVQSIAFSKERPRPRFLISIGTFEDGAVGIYNLEKGGIVQSTFLKPGIIINQVRVDPWVGNGHLQFFLAGNYGELYTCRYDHTDPHNERFDFYAAQIPDHLAEKNFTTIAFTERLPEPVNARYVVIGADDGTLLTLNDSLGASGKVVDEIKAQQTFFDNGEIMAISIRKHDTGFHSVIIATSDCNLYRYEFKGTEFYPNSATYVQRTNDLDSAQFQSSIVAMSFDSENKEGLVGTEQGCIFLVIFDQPTGSGGDIELIRIISNNNMYKEAISMIKYDDYNPALVLANTSQKSGDVKLYTSQNCDQVLSLQSDHEQDGHVVFVIAMKYSPIVKKRFSLVGFSNGTVKRIDWYKLKLNETVFKVEMLSGEQITCGYYSENDLNFVMGTNYGNIFLCSLPLMGLRQKQLQGTFCKLTNVGRLNTIRQHHDQSNPRLNKDIADNTPLRSQGYDFNFPQELDIDRAPSELNDENIVGIVSVHFLSIDPIGTMLVAFDNGMVKVWQNVVKNEQLMKILELNQISKSSKDQGAIKYDISTVGYQQFDLIDTFDMFDQETEKEEADIRRVEQLKSKRRNCQAVFLNNMENMYMCYTDMLQFIYIRDWKKQTVRQINLKTYPTCIKAVDGSSIKGSGFTEQDQMQVRDIVKGKNSYLLVTGSKNGRVQVWHLNNKFGTPKVDQVLFESPEGLSYGSITSIDVNQTCSEIVCGTESGEILQFDLGAKLDE